MLPEWAYSLIVFGFLGSVILLACWIGRYRESHPPKREWETISYNWLNPDYRIPQFIQNYIKHTDLHELSHKLMDRKVPYLNDKHYEYKIYAMGQGGMDIIIERRKIT